MADQRDPIWNVSMRIVELVAAPTADEAVSKVRDRLRKVGIEVFDDPAQPPDVFESEDLDPDTDLDVRNSAMSTDVGTPSPRRYNDAMWLHWR